MSNGKRRCQPQTPCHNQSWYSTNHSIQGWKCCKKDTPPPRSRATSVKIERVNSLLLRTISWWWFWCVQVVLNKFRRNSSRSLASVVSSVMTSLHYDVLVIHTIVSIQVECFINRSKVARPHIGFQWWNWTKRQMDLIVDLQQKR